MATRFYLAVDCGGTKAAAVISDGTGRVLGRGLGGPANFTDVGWHVFFRSLRNAVDNAMVAARSLAGDPWGLPPSENNVHEQPAEPLTHDLAEALLGLCRRWSTHSRAWKRTNVHQSRATPPVVPNGPSPQLFEAAWLGVAGVDSATTVHLLGPPVAALLGLPAAPTPRLVVANDTSLLAAPVHDLPAQPNASRIGVVVIAGTGSIVTGYRLGRGASSDLASFGRVGGLGWLLGDEGSGYAVGREAVRAVLRQADAARSVDGSDGENDDLSDVGSSYDVHPRGQSTEPGQVGYPYALRDRILTQFGLSSTDQLFGVIYASDPAEVKREPGPPEQPRPPSTSSSPLASQAASLRLGPNNDDRLLPPGPSAPARDRPVTPVPPLSTERPGTPSSGTTTSASETEDSPDLPSAQLTEAKADAERADQSLNAAVEWAQSVTQSTTTDESRSSPSKNGANGLERDRTIRPRHRRQPNVELDDAEAKPSSSPTHRANKHSSNVSDTVTAVAQAPKHRLASLAPLVFHLAFSHEDPLALLVLRTQADCIARQIAELVRPTPVPKAHEPTYWAWDHAGATLTGQRRPRASDAVLCMGGSLLGVDAYAELLLAQLATRGIQFARATFVPDPARSGALALARLWEARFASGEASPIHPREVLDQHTTLAVPLPVRAEAF